MDGRADSAGPGDEGPGGRVAGGDAIDSVRELLFGPQLQGLERQIIGIEGRVMGEVVQRTGQLSARIDALEDLVREEFGELRRLLVEERRARQEGEAEGVERDRLVDGKLEASERAVREAMGEVARRLGAEIEDVRDDVMRVMRERVAELDGAMVKRGAFGEMLMDLGLRLQPEGGGEEEEVEEAGEVEVVEEEVGESEATAGGEGEPEGVKGEELEGWPFWGGLSGGGDGEGEEAGGAGGG